MKIKRLQHWQIIDIGLVIYDILAVNLSYALALWVRFDCRISAISAEYRRTFLIFAPFYTVISVFIFWRMKLYNSIWRFASYSELLRVAAATVLTFIVQLAGTMIFFTRMPVTYYILGVVIQFFAVLAVRFSYRIVLMERRHREKISAEGIVHVMLIGAGSAGQMILRDSEKADQTKERIVCIIDDNKNKVGRYIDGVPVVGTRDDIPANVEKYNIRKIYIAIPSAPQKDRKEILEICRDTGCELLNLPGIYQLLEGSVTVSRMKKVSVEDLLGREPIKVCSDEILEAVRGRTVMVTGGGGSIGSELCRQLSAHSPKLLIIFDVYENGAYDIQQELLRNWPNLNLKVLIGSVRDSRRLDEVFGKYRPDIVYHAAAHKHVPLMEDSPNEAIKNNVIGTYKTAYAAMHNGCGRFILISTDKAVNPTNIMGASKRLCEMVIQSFDYMIKKGTADKIPALFAHSQGIEEVMSGQEDMRGDTDAADPKAADTTADGMSTDSSVMSEDEEKAGNGEKESPGDIRTEFVAVRFGNVLGSNGSVIPLFRKQIEAGGPVTVTDPRVIRYFMTIPEAVSLVLQAGVYAKGGEIFVLDMGSPVKIDDLARNLIKLSGFKPGEDIRIEYTGLRPGEKLYEEKLMDSEGLKKTANNQIYIGCPVPFDADEFLSQLKVLFDACCDNSEDIKDIVAGMVPTYRRETKEEDLSDEARKAKALLEEEGASKKYSGGGRFGRRRGGRKLRKSRAQEERR